MGKSNCAKLRFDSLQVVAVILVLIIAGFLGVQWMGTRSNAASVSNYSISIALTDNQPEALSQAIGSQKVAQFQLTTNSPSPVTISAFKFNVLGGVKNKIFRRLNLLPLSLIYQSETIGMGEGWVYDYGAIEQVVVLSKSLTLSENQPVVLDIYTDLYGQKDQAFGLDLVGVDSPLLVEGMPVQSLIYKITR